LESPTKSSDKAVAPLIDDEELPNSPDTLECAEPPPVEDIEQMRTKFIGEVNLPECEFSII
jgi:ribonucleoside-diphosphate reductase subunit M2